MGHMDAVSIAFPRLVDGVGENFKHRVLAALQIVRTKDDCRALAHPILALEHGDTGISVLFLFFHVASLPA